MGSGVRSQEGVQGMQGPGQRGEGAVGGSSGLPPV